MAVLRASKAYYTWGPQWKTFFLINLLVVWRFVHILLQTFDSNLSILETLLNFLDHTRQANLAYLLFFLESTSIPFIDTM